MNKAIRENPRVGMTWNNDFQEAMVEICGDPMI